MSSRKTEPVTKGQYAYTELRSMILGGELPPGTRLMLRQLADDLNVSVMPVRDALRALEADGLVTTDGSHRGARVTEVSADQILVAVNVRMWIQVLATREATPLHNEASLSRVKAALDAGAAALEAHNPAKYSDLNRRFHNEVEAPAPKLTTDLVEDLWNQLWQVRLQRSIFRNLDGAREAQLEHEALYEALVDHDADRAAAIADQHRVRTLSAWASLLGINGDDSE